MAFYYFLLIAALKQNGNSNLVSMQSWKKNSNKMLDRWENGEYDLSLKNKIIFYMKSNTSYSLMYKT